MKLDKKAYRIIKWAPRFLSLAVLIFGLPFYFGYGNPLPFIDPEYTLWDNIWLTVFPVMFAGLLLGLKFPKVGGYITVACVVSGLISGLILQGELVFFMLVPLAVGCLYLVSGYSKAK